MVTLGARAAVGFGGARLTGPLFRFIAVAKLRELFTATALMMIIGIALLMSLVGLSPALGTFLAGVVLANSEYRHELESDIDPFRGLLLGLFFMTVGAGINFGLLASNLALIIVMTLALMSTKFVVLFILGTVFNLRGGDRWLFALAMAQAGEFGFVLLSFTVANSVIPAAIADQLLLVVALSMILTPALFVIYDRVILPRMYQEPEREADAIEETGDIIIAGHGRVGGIVNRMLRSFGFETTVIDFNSAHLEIMRKFDMKIYYGDATRPDLLNSAGISHAKLLVIAIDNKDQITEMVKYMVKHHPHVHIIARAIDRIHVYNLYSAGCRDIIRDTYDSSIRTGRSALEALGISKEWATKLASQFEEKDRQALIDLAPLYDEDRTAHENPEFVEAAKKLVREQEEEMLGAGRAALEDALKGEPLPDAAKSTA